MIYASLIGCLEFYESSGNPKAVGEAGEIGCLQFMSNTFNMYCQGNIWDCDAQRRCADYMIQDNWNNVYQWSTAKNCL